jgi:hypothetical protein
MIADLLEHYYEAYDQTGRYEIARSIVVDGHEVAWCSYENKVLAGPATGETYHIHVWVCECDFVEGVGWQIRDGHRYSIHDQEKCLRRKAAAHLVQLELRDEYLAKWGTTDWGTSPGQLRTHLGEIVADLAAKVQNGVCIGEDGNGAAFWGGWFYLGTLASIIDCPVAKLWEPIGVLAASGAISLEGAVVCPPRGELTAEVWEEYLRIERDECVGIAYLPGDRRMDNAWKLCVGPDVEDVHAARLELTAMMDVWTE